ncbi:hypothetical protein [Massilia brevitalea]|uniref:hypothetical protein n=1 Tax=Massilia brevitalea TaxID=442526 RepID=UPI00273A2AB8|nr:hypothetical protein [Massilia brevitalea]
MLANAEAYAVTETLTASGTVAATVTVVLIKGIVAEVTWGLAGPTDGTGGGSTAGASDPLLQEQRKITLFNEKKPVRSASYQVTPKFRIMPSRLATGLTISPDNDFTRANSIPDVIA